MKKIKEKARQHLGKTESRTKKFRSELNKAMSTAMIAAFGFLIALIWRDVIQEWVNKIAEASPVQGKLISALIVTIICVIGIFVVTKFFKGNQE